MKRMSKGDFKTLGASAHSKEQREENDFYATDPKALEIFLEQSGIELRNVLRICEVRTLKLNTNLNSVFHIYAVSKS